MFNFPHGFDVDAGGNVYVADTGNERIQKFTRDGAWLTQWGSLGAAHGQFDAPVGVACGMDGIVYVADERNNRIQAFTAFGSFVRAWGTAGTANGQFDSPFHVAVDAAGNVLVADTGNTRIQKFTADGRFLAAWPALEYPAGIAVHPTGRIYVSVYLNNRRIQHFAADGTGMILWALHFNMPRGVAADLAGSVYVADLENKGVRKFTSAGILLAEWDAPDEFEQPIDIAVYENSVFVLDAAKHRVVRFDYPVAIQPSTWTEAKLRYRE
jgi:DNA-binding beta-propeller fold protein YncE